MHGDSGDRVPAVGGAKVPSNRKTSQSWNSYVNEDNFCHETCAVNPCKELNLRLVH